MIYFSLNLLYIVEEETPLKIVCDDSKGFLYDFIIAYYTELDFSRNKYCEIKMVLTTFLGKKLLPNNNQIIIKKNQ